MPMTGTGDDGTRPIGARVVEAVADETGRDPLALEPLYAVVDPECLESIFRSNPSVAGRDANRVEFWYAGCRVVVASDGTIGVSPADDEPATSAGSDRSNGSSGVHGAPD